MDIEHHSLVWHHGLGLNSRLVQFLDVDEDVLRSILGYDEAITLVLVEPANLSSRARRSMRLDWRD